MTDIKHVIDKTLVPHTAFMDAMKRLEQCYHYAEGALEPICLPIVGESRTGKSRLFETLMLNHPESRTEEGKIVPILSVRTPSMPTVKGLVELMLITLGDPIHNKGTEQAKTFRLKHLIKECGTRMIIVDEFQHFVDKGSSKIAHHVADWLKTLVDESCVAIVVVGLPNCIEVLQFNEQLAGRFMAPITMPRFDWRNSDHREEFAGILYAFHEEMALHFDLPDLSSDEMVFRFFCATGGLIGLLTKLLRFAVWMAMDECRHQITLEDFAVALSKTINPDYYSAEELEPFSNSFSIKPSTELLARITQIGKRKEVAITSRGKSRSSAKIVEGATIA